MWVAIESDVFQQSDFKGINYIYQILSWYPSSDYPRYQVFVDLTKIEQTENYSKLQHIEQNLKAVIDDQFNEFITIHPKKKKPEYQITLKKGRFCFNLEEAIVFFSQPISIVLENNKNDSSFIVTIINHFDRTGIVKSHLKNAWIKFENAGGCSNVDNFIEGFLQVYQDIALRHNRDVSDYFRGMVILDSDKEYPTQPRKPEYEKLLQTLSSKGINNVHVLEKRMMENYMPDEVFEDLKFEFSSNRRYQSLVSWVNVYQNLSNEQKDFLKYNDGLGDDLPNLPLDVQKLYSDQSTKNFSILKGGFKYKGKEFKNQFPRLFLDSNRVNRHTLQKRAGSNELEEIFQKISNLV